MTKSNSSFLKSVMIGTSTLILSGCLSVMPALAPKAKNVEQNISAEFPYTYRYANVNGDNMAYIEAGNPDGPVVVLVHGNPTSAYLWRNVIPHLDQDSRIIAVDLVGMGQSAKPDIDYRLSDHAAYFQGFMETMGLTDVVLVLHDWGGGVGLDYAAKNPQNIRGIAHFEAALKPMSLSDADFATRFLFGRLRDPEAGHRIIAEDNYFVEKMLPMMSGRDLTEQEMAAYRAPYPDVESRKPVRQWPLEIPLDGEPADNTKRMGDNYDWLVNSDVPVLMLYAEPGMIWTKKTRPQLTNDMPRMKVVSIGSGMHYLQEVQPTKIGQELSEWISSLETNSINP